MGKEFSKEVKQAVLRDLRGDMSIDEITNLHKIEIADVMQIVRGDMHEREFKGKIAEANRRFWVLCSRPECSGFKHRRTHPHIVQQFAEMGEKRDAVVFGLLGGMSAEAIKRKYGFTDAFMDSVFRLFDAVSPESRWLTLNPQTLVAVLEQFRDPFVIERVRKTVTEFLKKGSDE